MGLHNFQFKKHELSFPKTFLHPWHKNCHKAIICNTIASYKTLVFCVVLIKLILQPYTLLKDQETCVIFGIIIFVIV